jgi:hypothetical protein
MSTFCAKILQIEEGAQLFEEEGRPANVVVTVVIQSVMLVFSTDFVTYCPSNLLSG